MELGAILLLAVAALVHSGWNLFAKKSTDKQAFLWLALIASVVVFAVPAWYLYSPIPVEGWLLILFSGSLEAVYFILLSRAYQQGDLSLVYPLARVEAPLFVTLLT